MIEITAVQISFFTLVAACIIWLIRLEGRLNAEIVIRTAEKSHTSELRTTEQRNVTQLEGRIMDALRDIKQDTARIEAKLDSKQDKEHTV